MKVIKKKIHGVEARASMMQAVDQLADVVGSTMGAKGRNVLLDKEYGAPLCINDGVTIIRELFFTDSLQNMAAQLIKDAAIKTNDKAGDGTTGATVLARAILKKGWELVRNGENPVLLRKQIEKAVVKAVEILNKNSVKVQEEAQVVQVAKVSVQDDELGEMIGKLVYKIGANGAVSLKYAMKPEVVVEREGGMRLEGQLTGGIVDNESRWETKLSKPKVIILKDNLEDHEFENKFLPFIRQFAESNPAGQITRVLVPAFLIIAENLPRRVIMMLNSNRNFLKWVWFRPTTAGKNMKEIYKDLVAITGGKIIEEEEGQPLVTTKIEDLGEVDLAVITRHDLVVTVNEERMKSDEYLDRCNQVTGQIENAEDDIEKEQIKERYANLTGGVATIKASAATDQATNELHLRIEDAVNATKSAMEEGIVAGGGVALFDVARELSNENPGEAVIKEACEASIVQILKNAGNENPKQLISTLEQGQGVNVLTDKVVDMKAEGIIDPTKVIRHALVNASSVAGLLLTSEFAVTTEEDETDAVRKFFNPPKNG